MGGCVRDGILGRAATDLDIEIFGAESLADVKLVINDLGPVSMVGQSYQVLKLRVGEQEFDFSLPRRDVKVGSGHRGFVVETDAKMSFEEAASRRDFTMNAMGFDPLTETLLDPFGGQADLKNKVLRHVGPAFSEDPLRALRAVQFVGRFELSIAPDTAQLCRKLSLNELARERVFAELDKLLLLSETPSLGFEAMEETGVLALFPELARIRLDRETWDVMMASLDRLSLMDLDFKFERKRRRIVMFSLLCRVMTPDECAAFLDRLTQDRELVGAAVRLSMETLNPDDIVWLQDADLDIILRRLSLKVCIYEWIMGWMAVGAEFEKLERLQDRAEFIGVIESAPAALILGRHMIELGVTPGPEVGKWVKQAYEAQLDGIFATEEDGIVWSSDQFLGH